MESRVVVINERAFSTTVQGVSRIESQSSPGIGNIRLYFQPGTEVGTAVAQVGAVSQTILRILPTGITPPAILPFNAANVPVAQLTIESDSQPENALFDYALNFLRLKLFTVPGMASPAPYGGTSRQINVDVDPQLAAAKGISPQDVSSTLQNFNLIVPAGVARIGKLEYNIQTNASPTKIEDFRRFPIKIVNGREVTLGDVAHIEDGHADQTNAVRINGKRSVFMNILKKSDASTLKVVDQIRDLLPSINRDSPPGTKARLDFDQSEFVRAAVNSVMHEAVLAAVLVSIMILLFLGSFRSVFIVCTSIPLSILASIIGLKLTGNSINTMTLGGLALSIGLLVDDATVEIENINRNRPISENITVPILRGAHQIALPAIVTTLAICIVFFPIALLTGPARFLFVPLALSVVFAMIASYVLSRTLVPVLSRMMLRNAPMEAHPEAETRPEAAGETPSPGLTTSRGRPTDRPVEPANPHDYPDTRMGRFSRRFNEKREHSLNRLRDRYGAWLEPLIRHPRLTLGAFGLFCAVSLLIPFLVVGRDFFPETDVGILKLHFRAPLGSRLEESERIIEQVEQHIRKIIPAQELQTINSMIGVPTFYNLAFVPSDNVASMDTEVLIALKPGDHAPSAEYRKKIRKDLAENFPGSVSYFQPADIVSQVLNFGLSAPLDVQFQSRDSIKAYEMARAYRDKLKLIPGAQDVVLRQELDYPSVRLNIDRNRSARLGLTQRDATSSLLYALTGSGLVAPNYFINPENNVNYSVVTKVPVKEISSMDQVLSVPITALGQNQLNQTGTPTAADLQPKPLTETLGNIAEISPTRSMTQISHVDAQRTIEVLANVEGRDLGSVVADAREALNSMGAAPKGMTIKLRGQNEVMEESFTKLGLGMILAAALVYLLMVTLFQSWIDPVIIMVAVPGSLCGVLWMLALTGSTINVESLMGTIMAIGIAVSNSNLMVTFANDLRVEKANAGGESSPTAAALEAAKVRLRPVLMTAIAMGLGMIPMALGLSESGAQNAPLGRAVIGGLIFSTFATLFVVPVAYAVLRRREPTKHEVRKLYHQEEVPFNRELEREAARELEGADDYAAKHEEPERDRERDYDERRKHGQDRRTAS
jgi:multidrug efflux pump subunit AcrB